MDTEKIFVIYAWAFEKDNERTGIKALKTLYDWRNLP